MAPPASNGPDVKPQVPAAGAAGLFVHSVARGIPLTEIVTCAPPMFNGKLPPGTSSPVLASIHLVLNLMSFRPLSLTTSGFASGGSEFRPARISAFADHREGANAHRN